MAGRTTRPRTRSGAPRAAPSCSARPAIAYVYFIYGMYFCLNAVTEADGRPGAVLIRAIVPEEGLDDRCAARAAGRSPTARLADGPGKLCRALGITRDHNGLDLVTSDELFIEAGVICAARQSRGDAADRRARGCERVRAAVAACVASRGGLDQPPERQPRCSQSAHDLHFGHAQEQRQRPGRCAPTSASPTAPEITDGLARPERPSQSQRASIARPTPAPHGRSQPSCGHSSPPSRRASSQSIKHHLDERRQRIGQRQAGVAQRRAAAPGSRPRSSRRRAKVMTTGVRVSCSA